MGPTPLILAHQRCQLPWTPLSWRFYRARGHHRACGRQQPNTFTHSCCLQQAQRPNAPQPADTTSRRKYKVHPRTGPPAVQRHGRPDAARGSRTSKELSHQQPGCCSSHLKLSTVTVLHGADIRVSAALLTATVGLPPITLLLNACSLLHPTCNMQMAAEWALLLVCRAMQAVAVAEMQVRRSTFPRSSCCWGASDAAAGGDPAARLCRCCT